MKNPFDMSHDELRAEVAFLMGWKFIGKEVLPHVAWNIWSPPSCPAWIMQAPPRYTESLDACSGFEKILNREQFDRYLTCLDECVDDNDEYYRHMASPANRCRAFILVKQYEIEMKELEKSS